MKQLVPLTIALFAVLSLTFAGCGSDSPEPSSTSESPAETGHADHGDHTAPVEMGGGQSDMDKMKTELAKLSPEDRASAGKQHMCPVSGKMLGTMGSPYKVEINGQQVWLCCPGCESKLRENPDEFLAKLSP
jgi:YHS domain-containing protein